MTAAFTQKLLKWNRTFNTRSMPWKGEKDPYKIWLSEIILQQTRVEQGWGYYEKFIAAFPNLDLLAQAPEQKVIKLWEGLGYYSRCRNLMETARKISKEYGGVFPTSYDQILELKGIGPYTAAAIASFAFGLPHAVVDGNVQRVLSRFFGIQTSVHSSAGKKMIDELASSLLDKKRPGIYNQAIMDFGSKICRPKNPLCSQCVQQQDCQAFRNNWIERLPIKEKLKPRKSRWFYYFILRTQDRKVYIRQRTNQDIWKGLYEFILWETGQPIEMQKIIRSPFIRKLLGKRKFTVTQISGIQKQQLTHQTLHGRFITIQIPQALPQLRDYKLINSEKIPDYPFPKWINSHLRNSLAYPE
jgi:A/G-specific adenine glycosylase